MGEISEEMQNRLLNEKPPFHEPHWKTSKGEYIPVSKLSKEHKASIIKMLENKVRVSNEWLKILK